MSFVASVKVGEQVHFGTFDVESEEVAKSSLLAQLAADGVEVDKKAKVHVEGAVSPEMEALLNSKEQLEAEQAATAAEIQDRLNANAEHIEKQEQ